MCLDRRVKPVRPIGTLALHMSVDDIDFVRVYRLYDQGTELDDMLRHIGHIKSGRRKIGDSVVFIDSAGKVYSNPRFPIWAYHKVRPQN